MPTVTHVPQSNLRVHYPPQHEQSFRFCEPFSMHQCLYITEVVSLIFNELYDRYGSDNETRGKTFYSLARTCRNFRDPAITRLWESIPTLFPVIKCAGRDVWKMKENRKGAQLSFSDSRRMTSSEIDTMKKYACLVRHFGPTHPKPFSERSSNTMTATVSTDVWKRLRRALKGEALFPNILSVSINDEHTMKFVDLFPASILTTFSLTVLDVTWHQTQTQTSMLTDFSTRCPDLKSVNLVGFLFDADAPVAALSHWKRLTRLFSAQMSSGILKAVSCAASNSLRYLAFESFARDEMVSSPTDVNFPVLEEASIGFVHMPNAKRFLDYFPAENSLHRLTITMRNTASTIEDDWLELLQVIKKRLVHLTYLDISEENSLWTYQNFDASPLSNAIIHILATHFSTLVHLRISRVAGFDTADDDLKALAEGLPLLEEFSLVDCTSSVELRNTIASLPFFAVNCPLLSSLTLGFNALIDEIPQESVPVTKHSNLTRLDVSYSPASYRPWLAKFLYTTFPRIQQILFKGHDVVMVCDEPSCNFVTWRDIFRLMEKFKSDC